MPPESSRCSEDRGARQAGVSAAGLQWGDDRAGGSPNPAGWGTPPPLILGLDSAAHRRDPSFRLQTPLQTSGQRRGAINIRTWTSSSSSVSASRTPARVAGSRRAVVAWRFRERRASSPKSYLVWPFFVSFKALFF